MSTDLKLSKAHIYKMIQSGGFLESLLSKLARPLMKAAIPLSKSVLAPLGITAAASVIDAGIQKKVHGSGRKYKSIIRMNQDLMEFFQEIICLKK